MKLVTYLRLLQLLRIIGAIPPNTFMICTRKTLLYLNILVFYFLDKDDKDVLLHRNVSKTGPVLVCTLKRGRGPVMTIHYLLLTGPPDKGLYPARSDFPPADQNVSSSTADVRRYRELNKVIIRQSCYVDPWYQQNTTL